jgi:hypothetical protein
MKMRHILLLLGVVFGIVFGFKTATASEEPWRIRINIPQCRLYLYRDRELYQIYPIAVGKLNTPSPVGEFRIVTKVVNPVWYPGKGRKPLGAGPSNPLGRYWLGLNLKGYGIHGNNSSCSIGKPVSNGCFRMDNEAIAELFWLVPVGTPVEITYTTITGWKGTDQQVYLELFPDIYQRTHPDEAALDIIRQLDPDRTPHFGALAKLVRQSGERIITVPYPVNIRADEGRWDGFSWNREIYIARTDMDNPAEKGDFPGYHALSGPDGLAEKYRFDWEPSAQTIRVSRFRLYREGEELTDALRLIQGRVYVELQRLAYCLHLEFTWESPAQTARLEGFAVSGNVKEGGFWVAADELQDICSYAIRRETASDWVVENRVKFL